MEKNFRGKKKDPNGGKPLRKRGRTTRGGDKEKKKNEFFRGEQKRKRRKKRVRLRAVNKSGGGGGARGGATDAIVSSKAPVWTYCIGMAYSMAAIIFAAGKKRGMLANSKVMLHQPLIGENHGGNASSVKSLSDSLLETKNQLVEIISRHTGMTKEEVDKEMNYDHYYTAKEAIKAHLADEIVGIDSVL